MNKKAKLSIIWGTTAAVAVSIGVGVGVPVYKATHKKNTYAPLSMTDTDPIFEGTTVGDLREQAKAETALADKTLLNKIEYQAAFYLYDKEQKASPKFARMYLSYDVVQKNEQMSKNTELITIYTKEKDAATTSSVRDDLDKKMNDLRDKNKSLQAEIDKIAKLITAIDSDNSKDINWDSDTLTSDYDNKLLLPRTKVREKQQKVFNDQKSAFVSSFSTSTEGLTEWAKELTAKFNGATSDKEAVDYLVYQQINSNAFEKNTYALNEEFTIKMLKSNAFKDALGTLYKKNGTAIDPNTDSKWADTKDIDIDWVKYSRENPYIFIGEDKHENDNKVYFMSSGTRDVAKMAIKGAETDNLAALKVLFSDSRVMKIRNAILGFKQGEGDSSLPWTVDAALIGKLFTKINFQSLVNNEKVNTLKMAIDQWPSIFSGFPSATPTKEKEVDEANTKQLIGRATAQSDSTQWKSGDLGTTPVLNSGYVDGFYPATLGIGIAEERKGLALTKDKDAAKKDGDAAAEVDPIKKQQLTDEANALRAQAAELRKSAGQYILDDADYNATLDGTANAAHTQIDITLNGKPNGSLGLTDIVKMLRDSSKFPTTTLNTITNITLKVVGDSATPTSLSLNLPTLAAGTNRQPMDIARAIQSVATKQDPKISSFFAQGDVIKPSNFLEAFRKRFISTFAILLKDKGKFTDSSIDISWSASATPENVNESDFMKQEAAVNSLSQTVINQFVKTELSDADLVKRTFGITVQRLFEDLTPATNDGIPQAFQIDPINNVYGMVSGQYGLHIVQYVYGSDFAQSFVDDAKTIANKQDKAAVATDYAKLVNDTFDQSKKLKDLFADSEFVDAIKKAVTNKEIEYDSTKDIIADAQKLIKTLEENKIITDINNANKQASVDWMKKGIDAKTLIVTEGQTIRPEDLYGIIYELAGGN